MPVDIQISDDDLRGFSDEARNHVKEAAAEYAMDLIEEANRIEAGNNFTDGPPEVTRGMVNDAKLLLRRGLGAPKKKMRVKIFRIVAAILPLAVGIMYDKTKLQESNYLLLFILLVSVAIVTVTISILTE